MDSSRIELLWLVWDQSRSKYYLRTKFQDGAQMRCREKWVEYGGKNNSYFLGLEKQRQIKKSINKLIDENNEK